MKLPIRFFSAKASRVRLGRVGQNFGDDNVDVWATLETQWRKAVGNGAWTLESAACAEVGGEFWPYMNRPTCPD